ncbi:hypothetical protein GDO81_005412 [Engystomops pustulosus]|uniref:Uncharacterized protein n=1 Tax=Engystomops pustulosus TaxID=76066 RepID=A0AAV7CQU8_ENGPU|nr:hypothetical protein GDO81_005412 [Engystomops pustulosus]
MELLNVCLFAQLHKRTRCYTSLGLTINRMLIYHVLGQQHINICITSYSDDVGKYSTSSSAQGLEQLTTSPSHCVHKEIPSNKRPTLMENKATL